MTTTYRTTEELRAFLGSFEEDRMNALVQFLSRRTGKTTLELKQMTASDRNALYLQTGKSPSYIMEGVRRQLGLSNDAFSEKERALSDLCWRRKKAAEANSPT